MKPEHIRLIVFLCCTIFAVGCSTPGDEQPDTGTAQIEDRGASDEDDESLGSAAQSQGIGDDASLGAAALDDPDSPLSVRIIYFAYDSSSVPPEFRPTVEAHATYLANNPSVTINLEGHADERGTREYNLALGERRALAVRRQLVLLGASAGQVRAVSYGEERPVVEGHDEESYQLNRRVEIIY
jgi:peptidoglycan-associated lipoprotein